MSGPRVVSYESIGIGPATVDDGRYMRISARCSRRPVACVNVLLLKYGITMSMDIIKSEISLMREAIEPWSRMTSAQENIHNKEG